MSCVPRSLKATSASAQLSRSQFRSSPSARDGPLVVRGNLRQCRRMPGRLLLALLIRSDPGRHRVLRNTGIHRIDRCRRRKGYRRPAQSEDRRARSLGGGVLDVLSTPAPDGLRQDDRPSVRTRRTISVEGQRWIPPLNRQHIIEIVRGQTVKFHSGFQSHSFYGSQKRETVLERCLSEIKAIIQNRHIRESGHTFTTCQRFIRRRARPGGHTAPMPCPVRWP